MIYKTAYEQRNVTRDFAGKAGLGNSITLVGVTAANAKTGADATSAIIAGAAVINTADSGPCGGPAVGYTVLGGSPGDLYRITTKVTTSAGESLEDDLLLQIYSQTFEEFQQAVADRIQDHAHKLSQEARDACIREAITGRYSAARPVKLIVDIAGDGVTYDWPINNANFPGWVMNYSIVEKVEYPKGQQEPVYLWPDDWMLYDNGDNSLSFRMTGSAVTGGAVPESGETMRITYTTPHAEDGSDVPAQDFYGVANLAASLASTRLAAIYMQLGDSQFGGDAIEYKDRSARYRALAADLFKAFEAIFGLDQEQTQPAASHHAEWRVDNEAGGKRLIH